MGERAAALVSFLAILVSYLRICSAASFNRTSVDESSLLALKTHITSDILAKEWSHETSLCSWIGVSCSRSHPRVTGLNLSNMGLHGSIAKEIGNLSFLVFLDMSGNNISGAIPSEISSLRRLRVLNMSYNKLSDHIPQRLGLLTKLKSLDLSNNHLSGDIPASLSACVQLNNLDLSINRLTGNIPAGFGNLSELHDISLRLNQLTEYGSEGLISTMVDVYSYGILLMEVISRREPTAEMFSGELTIRKWISESYPDSVLEVVDNELVNVGDKRSRAKHEICFRSTIKLALECTADMPEERPNMKVVLATIKKIKFNVEAVA